jgi:hypothetical protein
MQLIALFLGDSEEEPNESDNESDKDEAELRV